MDILLDKKTPTEALIKITLKEADYQPKVEEKLKEYSKKAAIKGFRPGKVPPALIKKMYGKSILADEINHLLSHSLNDYIKDNKLKILGEPLPEKKEDEMLDLDNSKEFEFIYNIGLVDDFQYQLDESIKVNRYEIELDDAYMAETIGNLQKQFGGSEETETSEAEDQLFGSLTNEESSFEKDILLPINRVASSLQSLFLGKKVDDLISFDLRAAFPKAEELAELLDQKIEEVTDLNGTYSFKIQKVSRNKPAELNQEFFDKVFGKDAVSSEEEFREKVKETIQENYNRETENFLNHEIKERLITSTKIDTPDDFLKRWLVQTNEGKITPEDVEKEYDLYLKELKWNLIQNRILEENNLKVEHAEVLEKSKDMLRSQFQAYGGGSQIEDFLDKYAEEYLKGENGENYSRIFTQVKNERILALIKEKISVEKKTTTLDEFKKVAMN